MRRQLRRDAIVKLSFEEMLCELAKEIGQRLNLDDYYDILRWATVYTLVPPGRTAAEAGVGLELGGLRYLALFMNKMTAESVASRCQNAAVVEAPAGEILKHVPDGWGIVVDLETDAELRITPDQVVELNERFRVWPVKQEATEEWLTAINAELAHAGVDETRRAGEAMKRWADVNGFRVLSDSRRARRIEHFFAVIGDGSDRRERHLRSENRWRAEYTREPYLHHLDDADLRARLSTILANQRFLDRHALPHELGEFEWSELLQHVRCEYERRGRSFDDAVQSAGIPNSWPRLQRVQEVFAAYSGPPGELFRYSKNEYLVPLLDRGDLTIFPATKYKDDTSLLPSQRDDELSRTILGDAAKARVEHIDRYGVKRPLPIAGTVRLTASLATNYYAWFTTTTSDPRLFDDFKCDGCLIIHDASTFMDRLRAAVEAALPRWVGAEKLVRYFDPLLTKGEVLGPFEKDFLYAYQREYRFVWEPPAPEIRKELPPLRLTIGSLRDVAELVSL